MEKCDSGWSKVQYVCDTIMLTLCLCVTTYFVVTGRLLNGTKVFVVWIEEETIVIMQWLLNGLAG